MTDLHIDKTWSLFLDRDGVINKKIDDDYVRRWKDFEFLPGALEAIKKLSETFGRILIVTNQRGIGRGLYSVDDLNDIHRRMESQIRQAGGRIDGIFYCPHLGTEAACDCRKPKRGMVDQALRIFPGIDLHKSVLAGDSGSDIMLGTSTGMKTVFISSKKTASDADFQFNSLSEFASEFN